MNLYREQCRVMGKHSVFICPLDQDKFMWLINNLENGKVGITSICHCEKNGAQFACLCVDTKKACYYEAEGFTIDDMVKDEIIKLVPCKDILSAIL
jgi:hypothetical protein